jgi:hypothetical protein
MAFIVDHHVGMSLYVFAHSLTLVCRVVPALKALPWDEQGWRRLLDQLVLVLAKLPGSLLGEEVASAVHAYAELVSITAADSSSYYSAQNNFQNQLEYCLKTGGALAAEVLLNRMFVPGLLTPQYIERTLVPLVPDLKKLALRLSIPLFSSPFSNAFKRIAVLYKETIMSSPVDITTATTLALATRRWTCSCADCQVAKRFLVEDESGEIILRALGAKRRAHVEGHLRSYAQALVSYKVTNNRPQGLLVSPSCS